jgi:hypothetical protein
MNDIAYVIVRICDPIAIVLLTCIVAFICFLQVVGAVLDRLLEVATIPENFNKPE